MVLELLNVNKEAINTSIPYKLTFVTAFSGGQQELLEIPDTYSLYSKEVHRLIQEIENQFNPTYKNIPVSLAQLLYACKLQGSWFIPLYSPFVTVTNEPDPNRNEIASSDPCHYCANIVNVEYNYDKVMPTISTFGAVHFFARCPLCGQYLPRIMSNNMTHYLQSAHKCISSNDIAKSFGTYNIIEEAENIYVKVLNNLCMKQAYANGIKTMREYRTKYTEENYSVLEPYEKYLYQVLINLLPHEKIEYLITMD